MNLFQAVKSLFVSESFCQKYARQHNCQLVEVPYIGWDLINNGQVVGHFPDELSACQRIYELATR